MKSSITFAAAARDSLRRECLSDTLPAEAEVLPHHGEARVASRSAHANTATLFESFRSDLVIKPDGMRRIARSLLSLDVEVASRFLEAAAKRFAEGAAARVPREIPVGVTERIRNLMKITLTDAVHTTEARETPVLRRPHTEGDALLDLERSLGRKDITTALTRHVASEV